MFPHQFSDPIQNPATSELANMTKFNRRDFLCSAVASGLLAGCNASKALHLDRSAASDNELSTQLQKMADQMLIDYPECATFLGIATDKLEYLNHRLTDRTAVGVAARRDRARERLLALRSMDLPDLAHPAQLNASVALAAHQVAEDGTRFTFGDNVTLDPTFNYRNTPYVVNQLGGAFIDFPDFLDSRHNIASEQDAVAFADRVDAYASNLDGETERLAQDRAAGVIAPDFTLDTTIKMIEASVSEQPDKTIIIAKIQKAVSAGNLDERIVDRVRQSVTSRVRPALLRQLEELKSHRAMATSEAGVWHFDGGDQYYSWALKASTTTTLTPHEIHQLGLDQVQAIQARMDSILLKQGMTGGTVAERMAALGRDPVQLYPNNAAGREQLLTFLNDRVANMRTRLGRAFATHVPAKLIIKRVPPAIEAGAPGGYAAAGTVDGEAAGQYYINLRDTTEWPRFTLPTLTYHEGIPGHIWQGEYANRMPLLRSMLAFNAYNEGWALYAEQLADEMGAYDDDPLGQLGYLQSSSFRACRLVVDTGLNALRWTREKAIDWLVKANGNDRRAIIGEIDRYCVIPGQACSYKVGHLEILRLREKAKWELAEKYDLRKFNDAVLQGGSVPLSLLETAILPHIAATASPLHRR